LLFVVEGIIGKHPYMNKSTFESAVRLVEANSAEEAMEKFNSKLSKSDPYAVEIMATATAAHEVIQ
jgi:hypothetical protein